MNTRRWASLGAILEAANYKHIATSFLLLSCHGQQQQQSRNSDQSHKYCAPELGLDRLGYARGISVVGN